MKGRQNTIELRLGICYVASNAAADDLNIVAIHIKSFQIDTFRFLRVTDLKPTLVRQLKRKCAGFETWGEGECLDR